MKRNSRIPRKLNPVKVRELAAQGLSIPDIAEHQGVNRSTVWRFLERLSPEQEALKRFQETRPDAFALLHGDTLQSHALALTRLREDLEDEDLMRATKPSIKAGILRDVAVAGGVIFDKERLERGQSTANIQTISKLIAMSDEQLFKASKILTSHTH